LKKGTVRATSDQSREIGAQPKAMLGRKQEINLQFQQLIDAVIFVFALWAAYAIRSACSQIPGVPEISPFSSVMWLIVLIMPFGPLLLDLQGFYHFPLRKTFLVSLTQTAQALLWLGILISGCALLFKLPIENRVFLVLFGILSCTLLLIKERFVISFLKARAHHGDFREKVILAGSAEEVKEVSNRLTEEQLAEVEIVARIDISNEPTSTLIRALHEHSVGRVIFLTARIELRRVEEVVAACEIEGVEAWVMADFIRTSIARPTFDMFGPQPMLVFRSTPDSSWALIMKRMIDFLGSLFGIILLSPLLLAVSIAVRLTSPGPAIFSQMRSGKNGKPFKMYKFRSMYSDAEQRRHELEAYNQMSGPVFKVAHDPRITRIGRELRRFSIDELPQLFNVVTGQMSIVGPRPLPVLEVKNFANTAQRRRLSVKPGLTCLWQIGGRSEINDFETWVKLDLEYIDNWSIWLDLKILFGTIPAVLFARGAK
jgi:exopolysaccharide biosynthesis polyprenyl glycosylphosphotransferase